MRKLGMEGRRRHATGSGDGDFGWRCECVGSKEEEKKWGCEGGLMSGVGERKKRNENGAEKKLGRGPTDCVEKWRKLEEKKRNKMK